MKKSLLAAFVFLFAAQAHASVLELIESVKQGNLSEVQELLAKGEDVNAVNEQGNTPLHYAVALDNPQMVELLLAKGANIKAENAKGWTPLLIAEKKQLPNVAPLLQKAQSKSGRPITQEDMAAYKKLLERAKQNLLTVSQQRDKAEAKNKELEQELERLKAQVADAKTAKNPAVSTSVVKKQTAPVAAKVAPTKTAVRPVVKPQFSKVIPQVYAGNEEIVYCLNYLGQDDNPSMILAAGYYAASVGISQERYTKIAEISNGFVATSGENLLKKRNEECSKIVTPKNAEQQNRIIRSLNKAIGF